MQVQAGPAWRELSSQVLTSRDEGCEPGFVDDGRRGQEAVMAVEKLQAAHVTAIWAGLGGCGTISSFQAGLWEVLFSWEGAGGGGSRGISETVGVFTMGS